MRASLFSLLVTALSSVTVLAQPPRFMTTLDLKQLSIEFDDQSRELSYVEFELSPPNGGFVIHCSNSRSFQVLPLPISPLKVLFSNCDCCYHLFFIVFVISQITKWNKIQLHRKSLLLFPSALPFSWSESPWAWTSMPQSHHMRANKLMRDRSSVAVTAALCPKYPFSSPWLSLFPVCDRTPLAASSSTIDFQCSWEFPLPKGATPLMEDITMALATRLYRNLSKYRLRGFLSKRDPSGGTNLLGRARTSFSHSYPLQ